MIQGYMIDVDYDGQVLRVHGRNKAARVALAGQDHEDDVIIPREQIAEVSLKGASALTNGNLKVRTTDGRKVQMHFRKKQAEDFQALAAQLQN